MSILWELRQQRKIREAEAAAATSATQTGSVALQLERLEQRVQTLANLSQAVWSLVQEQTDLTDQDLEHRLNELRAAKAAPEGQAKANLCPKCGRPLQDTSDRCMYCGAARVPGTVFDGLR